MSKHDGYCAMGLDGRYTNLQCECDFIGLVREDQNERIIKLLEAECDCDFYEKYKIPNKCHAHKHIALIKGEK